MHPPRVIILMGVAGSGKSTVGALLAARNHGRFFDADDFHPESNKQKMADGIPLDDDDRAPWLTRLREEVIDLTPADGFDVLACSALKKSYREQLSVGTEGVGLIYLKGDVDLLTDRLLERPGHYMKAGMLGSQRATLEEPAEEEGITIGIEPSVDEIVVMIEEKLGLGK